MSINTNIMWTEIFKEMPWVKYLKEGQRCERLRSGAPMVLIFPNDRRLRRKAMTDEEYKALYEKHRCKNSARWRYTALKNSWTKSGIFCWSHILSNIDMDEELRIDRWLKRHHSGLRWRS